MTPKTPPPSDGPDTPPPSRPVPQVTAKDSEEQDLWALDGENELEESPRTIPPQQRMIEPRRPEYVRPAEPASDTPQKPQLPTGLPEAASEPNDSIRVNLNPRVRPSFTSPSPRSARSPEIRATAGEIFDDLDQWEESAAPPTMPPSAFKEMPVASPSPASTAQPAAPAESDRDEFAAPAPSTDGQPAALRRPALHLNFIERAGMALLALLLVAVGALFYFSTIRQIPSGSKRVTPGDFPILGAKAEILTAQSYWREPVVTGPDADTVQLETLLIPEVQLTTRGGPAILRILFHNEHGDPVGDVITRTVQGEQNLTLTSTAGFDDLSKHAAYRAGQTQPWTIEVLEAPPGKPAPGDFKRLFEMNISSNRR